MHCSILGKNLGFELPLSYVAKSTLLICFVETDLNFYFVISLAESYFVSGSIIKGSVTELQRGVIFLFYL